MAEQEKRLVEATQLLQEHFSSSQLRQTIAQQHISLFVCGVFNRVLSHRQDRYEAYRRSNLKEGAVRKVMNSGTRTHIHTHTHTLSLSRPSFSLAFQSPLPFTHVTSTQ